MNYSKFGSLSKLISLKKLLLIGFSIFLFAGPSTSAYAAHHGAQHEQAGKSAVIKKVEQTTEKVSTKLPAKSDAEKKEKTDLTKTLAKPNNLPRVVMETSSGKLIIELYPKQAPVTVKNFLKYVNDKFYDGTIFHRIVPGFVIQGGGFTYDFKQKPTRKAIVNEANNGLKNSIATLSMARTNAPNSATSQFFINTVDNRALDPNPSSAGYAVFGKVVEGFNIVKKIEREPRGLYRQHPEAPNYPVIIEKAYVLISK